MSIKLQDWFIIHVYNNHQLEVHLGDIVWGIDAVNNNVCFDSTNYIFSRGLDSPKNFFDSQNDTCYTLIGNGEYMSLSKSVIETQLNKMTPQQFIEIRRLLHLDAKEPELTVTFTDVFDELERDRNSNRLLNKLRQSKI